MKLFARELVTSRAGGGVARRVVLALALGVLLAGWGAAQVAADSTPGQADPPAKDLGAFGGTASEARAINDDSQVVGQFVSGGQYRAFSWTQTGGVVDLGTLLGSSISDAKAVNNSGRVVGEYQNAGFETHAFSWTAAGGIADLGTLGGPGSKAAAVNDSGQVVGQSYNEDFENHAFSWTAAGGMVDLGTLGGTFSSASAVNDSGQVVGDSTNAAGSTHAFSWTEAGGIVDLGVLGIPPGRLGDSMAFAVNSGGQVVGQSYTSTGDYHAFSWTAADGMEDLGTLGGSTSLALTVNDIGQVVGRSNIAGNTAAHAFSWTDAGGMVDIGTLGGATSVAVAVNNSGMVAGWSLTETGAKHAFSWTSTGGIVDLGTIGGTYSEAVVVNDNGQIAGKSTTTNNAQTHATLWGADSDGDGLPDTWEEHGVTIDGEFLDLPTMGADPFHRDVFVEVDAMAGHELDQAAIDMIVDSFAQAPIENNPDGSVGIALHVDNGPLSTMDPRTGATWGSLSDSETLAHVDVLGSMNGESYQWDAFDDLKDSHFKTSRRVAFHYAIGAHYSVVNPDGKHPSGIARTIPGTDFIVSLTLRCVPPADCNGSVGDQAGTFMHELGHTLGLHHGGGDELNNKPNYLSVMNYTFQFPGLSHGTSLPTYDYSRYGPEDLGSLHENDLSEPIGFPITNSFVSAYISGYVCPNGLKKTVIPGPDVDWNCNQATTPGYEAHVQANINGDVDATGAPLFDTLDPFEDWSHLVYDGGGSIGNLGATVEQSAETAVIEPSIEELLEWEALFHAPADDTTPPVVTVPDDITAQATGPTGRAVTFTATAHDTVDGNVAATCTPASGSTFPLGQTTVNCEATDAHHNTGHASFKITITPSSSDTTPPVLTLPSRMTADATGPDGAIVILIVSALDAVDGPRPVACTPPSGTRFAIGDTTVACSASDTSGNTAHGTLTVHVSDAIAQLAALQEAVAAAVPRLPRGLGNQLQKPLEEAAKQLEKDKKDRKGKPNPACRELERFVDAVRDAEKRRTLDGATAADWVRRAEQIGAVLGC